MKEDILEQIADDYLQFKGYFTTHNVRFKPDPAHPDYVADLDRVPSDVDVVALHPTHGGSERVLVVTCKSWHLPRRSRYRRHRQRSKQAPTAPTSVALPTKSDKRRGIGIVGSTSVLGVAD